MTLIRRLILALALMAGITPAFAQIPPPVPALPDTERRTTYSISASICSCAVNFALFGDSTDYQNWLTVWVNGVQVQQSGNWTITSPTGSLATIPRPITDAVLTFTQAQTGTVQIVGARRPRRVSQFPENRGVAARDLNQVITDLTAQNRELWDRQFRTVQAPPGETLNVLSILASRANMGACFDSGGNLVSCVSVPSGTFAAGSGVTFTGTNPTTISVPTYAAGSGVLFTGTNPTVISVPSLTSSVFSPLSYGVICDGASHAGNAANFQTALNAAIAASGILQLPASNCVMEASITNTGTFVSTQIKGYNLGSKITFQGNFGFVFSATAGYYALEDFAVTCQTTSNSACIQFSNATQSTAIGSIIKHLTVTGGITGISLQNMVETSILYNVIQTTHASGVYGIFIDNTQTADVGANFIQSNTIVNVSGATVYGLFLQNCGGTQTQNNAIGGYSYDIFNSSTLVSGAATGILIQGNQLDNYTVAGIYFSSTGAGGVIVHVAVNNNTLHALQAVAGIGSLGIAFAEAPGNVAWSVNITVTGNVIDTFSGTGGILMAGASDFVVSGNSIHDEGSPTGAAIKTNASSSSCMVIGNVVTNYGTKFTNTAACTTSGATN